MLSSEFGSLVKVAWTLLDKFSTGCRCVDEFIENVSTDLQVRKFILDVFSGCVEYEKLLDIVVNTFYGQHRKWLCKRDRNQFIVICYLCMFCLDQLGLEHFSTIVKSLGRLKMHFFLDFFFSNITTWVQEEWNAIYEPEFVEKHWITPLLSLRFISQSSSITTQRETVQLVNICSRDYFTVQHALTSTSASFQPQKLLQAIQYRCWDPEKSEQTEVQIDELVQGAVDPSPFLQRLKELEERERQEKRQAEERSRLETQIIEKEIILIRKRIAEQKHEAALRKKEETAHLKQRYAEKRVKEEKEIKDLVQQVMEGRINSKVAQERSKKTKQKIVKEVSEEKQELLRQALQEKQEEFRKRSQIVREIHVIESLPIVKSNKFDETETAGYELLGEMSLAELKERLALLRQNQQKEEEERRSNILEEKQKKKQQILETLDNINLYRKLLMKEAADRLRAQQELLKQVVNEDETIVALKKKLEDKKQAFHKVKEVERSQLKPSKRLVRRESDQVSFLQGSISLPASTSVVLLSFLPPERVKGDNMGGTGAELSPLRAGRQVIQPLRRKTCERYSLI
uniref:Cilia and flagella associated protein 99 n=1 Tax=Poecilia reticulata TaxID=8081 RepID=A0A3P9PJZ2_POERE